MSKTSTNVYDINIPPVRFEPIAVFAITVFHPLWSVCNELFLTYRCRKVRGFLWCLMDYRLVVFYRVHILRKRALIFHFTGLSWVV